MPIRKFNSAEDTVSLTDFKRNTKGVMKQVRKAGRPAPLTVRGKTQAILLTPEQYQTLVNRLNAFQAIAAGNEAGSPSRRLEADISRPGVFWSCDS
jgi:prevent-host-death family protein